MPSGLNTVSPVNARSKPKSFSTRISSRAIVDPADLKFGQLAAGCSGCDGCGGGCGGGCEIRAITSSRASRRRRSVQRGR